MPDFLIVVDKQRPEVAGVADLLRHRPYMRDTIVSSWTFPWGVAVAQHPRCDGYEPLEIEDDLFCCVGRARRSGPSSVDDRNLFSNPAFLRSLFDLGEESSRSYAELTGVFSLVRLTATSATVITDKMGSYPVYHAVSKSGDRTVIGTQPDFVARLAGRASDYDEISLAQILVRDAPTFPYTTRTGMRELGPGRKHLFEAGSPSKVKHHEQVLWLPREPQRWLTLKEAREALTSAIPRAVEECTHGSGRVAFTLSAGSDSRILLATTPHERRAASFTFADVDNWEVRVARQVADKAGIPHHVIYRRPDLYADLVLEESQLVGMERSFLHGHGLAMADQPPDSDYDLLLCGFVSDTILKGLYTPAMTFSERMRRAWQSQRNTRSRLRLDDSYPEAVRDLLTPDMFDQMKARRQRRVEEIAEFRPVTAEEWYRIYPVSRGAEFSYAAVNQRLFPSELPFLHNEIVDVVSRTPWHHKALNVLAPPVFSRLCGDLSELPASGTRLSMSTSLQVLFARRCVKKLTSPARRVRRAARKPPEKEGWFTDGSWIDSGAFQRQSKQWDEMKNRARETDHPALSRILRTPPSQLLSRYQAELGPSINYTLVKMALNMHGESSLELEAAASGLES